MGRPCLGAGGGGGGGEVSQGLAGDLSTAHGIGPLPISLYGLVEATGPDCRRRKPYRATKCASQSAHIHVFSLHTCVCVCVCVCVWGRRGGGGGGELTLVLQTIRPHTPRPAVSTARQKHARAWSPHCCWCPSPGEIPPESASHDHVIK